MTKYVIENFQSMSVEQGKAFCEESLRALRLAGFEIVETEFRIPSVGIRLDALTNNRHGIPMAWEFKGSLQGVRPGLRRSDTVRKMIAQAALLSVSEYAAYVPPLLVMTSHLPDTADVQAMIEAALQARWVLKVVDSRDGKALTWLVNATQDNIAGLMANPEPLGKAARGINAVPKQHVKVSKDHTMPSTASRRQSVTAAQLGIQFGT